MLVASFNSSCCFKYLNEKMGLDISSLVFQPPKLTYINDKRDNLIYLATKKGAKIPALYIDRRAQVTVLFSHGNAEDLGLIHESFMQFTKELNVNLLAYEYEGYGRSSGFASEHGCYDDIDAAYGFLVECLHQLPQNILVYGRSLGSGPSCYLAERLSRDGVRLGGLVLQSPLLSVYRVAFNFRFTLPGDMFPNVDRMANMACPVLIIHGTRDEIVPFWNGEMLFLETPVCWRARPMWIDGAGHNNIEMSPTEHGTFIDGFRSYLIEWIPNYASNAHCVHRYGSGSFLNTQSEETKEMVGNVSTGTKTSPSSIPSPSLLSAIRASLTPNNDMIMEHEKENEGYDVTVKGASASSVKSRQALTPSMMTLQPPTHPQGVAKGNSYDASSSSPSSPSSFSPSPSEQHLHQQQRETGGHNVIIRKLLQVK